MIKDKLDIVDGSIKASCQQADRNVEDITLITVSKTQPIEVLEEAYKWGCRDFGENKVQEIIEKYPLMPQDTRWHMIGHLQRNKVKYIIDKVVLIHSVDSIRLAEEISKQAMMKNLKVAILIEVNIALEPSKYGVHVEDIVSFVKEVSNLKGITIKGFMAIAPYVENPEDNRKLFRRLQQISVDILKKNIDNVKVDILSMGMSGDYNVAIQEGATMVRVGTSIFGHR